MDLSELLSQYPIFGGKKVIQTKLKVIEVREIIMR